MTAEILAVLTDLGLALTAGVIALPIGWERERAERPAGLRTFPIVALASCAFVVLGMNAFPDSPQAQARILQGLMTGIGFVGGGAILRGSHEPGSGTVPGIATAASIWNTGAIGAAVGMRNFQVALILMTVNFLVLRFVKPVAGVEDEADEARRENAEG